MYERIGSQRNVTNRARSETLDSISYTDFLFHVVGDLYRK